jgi:hypothetical protein
MQNGMGGDDEDEDDPYGGMGGIKINIYIFIYE